MWFLDVLENLTSQDRLPAPLHFGAPPALKLNDVLANLHEPMLLLPAEGPE